MNEADISFSEVEEPPSWSNRYRDFCISVMESIGFHGTGVSILFCSDEFIRYLNRSYRHKDEVTDVLSFQQTGSEIPGTMGKYAGDIAISLDTVKRHADEFGVEYEEELKRVTIHAFLHLNGFTHTGTDPGEPMLLRQEQIINQFDGERIFQ
jgi:probable rRNA maturation factor